MVSFISEINNFSPVNGLDSSKLLSATVKWKIYSPFASAPSGAVISKVASLILPLTMSSSKIPIGKVHT